MLTVTFGTTIKIEKRRTNTLDFQERNTIKSSLFFLRKGIYFSMVQIFLLIYRRELEIQKKGGK